MAFPMLITLPVAFGLITLPAPLYLAGFGLIIVPLVVMEIGKAIGALVNKE